LNLPISPEEMAIPNERFIPRCMSKTLIVDIIRTSEAMEEATPTLSAP
jgi:hypothetical protein